MKRVFTFVLSLALVFVIPFSAIAGGLPEGTTDSTPAETISNLNEGAATKALGSVPTAGRTYNLHSGASSNSYLNVWGGIDADGTRVDMWAKDGSTEQKFKLVNGSVSGTFRLQAVCSASNRVVDAYSPSRPIQSGAGVDIWLPNDAPAQNLSIINVGVNSYKIVLSSYSTLALTAVSTANDGAVKFNTYTGASNQIWYFEEVGGSSGETSYGNMGWLWPIYNGTPSGITCGFLGYAGHNGMDIGGVSIGTPVRSAQSGTVVLAYDSLNASENQGCGYAIAIRTSDKDPNTGNNLIYMYQHFCEAPLYSSGQYVNKGVTVGKVGETGNAQGAHVHMQVSKHGNVFSSDINNFVNPQLFYPNRSLSSLETSAITKTLPIKSYSFTKENINKYFVDMNIINAIGIDKYENWKKDSIKAGKELTVNLLLSDFNISKNQFIQLTKGSNLNYDVAYITSGYVVK